MILLAMPFAIAVEEGIDSPRFVGKQNENLTIYDTCTVNGFPCDANFNCTFTIIKPDQTTLVSQAQTTHIDYLYIYHLNETQTVDHGVYEVTSYCGNGTTSGKLTFYYVLTPTGTIPSTAQSLLYSFLLVVCLFILTLTIIGGVKMDGKNTYTMSGLVELNHGKYLKMGLFFLSYLFLLFTFFLAYQVSTQFLFLGFASTVFEIGHTVLWIAFFPIFLVFVVLALIQWVIDIRLADLTKRGLRPYGK